MKYVSGLFKRTFNHPRWLAGYYLWVTLAPNLYFAFHTAGDIAGGLTTIFLPLGIYLFLFSRFRNTGKVYLFLFPLTVLNAFQIVLFYLFKSATPIASDMFLNVVTTSGSEVGELLGSLSMAIVTVCVLYLPPIALAVRQWIQKNGLGKAVRKKMLGTSLVYIAVALLLLPFSRHREVYPANVGYNLGFACHKLYRIHHYPETSKGFPFQATRTKPDSARQLIVLVIGETSRADNWALYGYHRATNPHLKNQRNMVLFKDAVTQNNATHKSVPMILSGTGAEGFRDIYYRKSIFEAFKEAGFTTICFSNQAENTSFTEYFYREADIFKDVRTEHPEANPYDMALVRLMDTAIRCHRGNLFIVLHSYGSHFKYADRYPPRFRKFVPDRIDHISKSRKQEMVNAYDNSILYTDYFLSETIRTLAAAHTPALLLYTSDHGEDLFDDKRGKFLHASPLPTYYQLHIPFLLWYSDAYQSEHPGKIAAVRANSRKPVATNAVFPTLLAAADIQTPYLNRSLSLVDTGFTVRTRMYLNDHDRAVPYQQMGLSPEDFAIIRQRGMGK